ncbi:MAG: GNAT family N-acetyltransferase [Saprospiraceae bacterium]
MNAQFFVAGRDDIEAILALQQEFYGIDNQKDVVKEVLLTLIDQPTYGKVWLTLVNGKVVGYMILTLGFSFELKGKNAFLDELYLQAPYRDQGIELRAIDFVATQCKAMGIKAIHLQVDINNTKNFLLYQHYGFQDAGRILMTRWV